MKKKAKQRLPGSAGGIARAKKLSAKRRREIAQMGGQANMRRLTPEQRKELASKAANIRWEPHRKLAAEWDAYDQYCLDNGLPFLD